MKPIKLTMQAFGPYKYKEVVDFTELHDNRIFLVSGNTGAGKTTIFDGIAYALYGHASGEDRKEHKSMRSDFAEDDTHTLIELVFETRGKTYRVARQLGHVKKGRKTASGENYEFVEIMPDGSEIIACEKQKSKEISQKIEEIIGLTYDQFNQIVMLPQGEFRKLLTSSTENKEAILRKIFKTERYSKIAEQLEYKKKDAEKQRDEAKSLRDLYIDQITGALPERDSELFERVRGEANIYQIVESLQAEKQYYADKQQADEQAYEQAQATLTAEQQRYAVIQQQNERLQQLQQQQERLQQQREQKPYYDALQQQVEQGNIALQIAAVFEALQQVMKELQQVEQNYSALQQQLSAAQQTATTTTEQLQQEQQTEPERKQLEQDIHSLQQIEPLFKQVAVVQDELQRAEATFQTIQQQAQACKEQLQADTEQLTHLQLQEEQLQEQQQAYPQVLVRKQQLQHALNQLSQYEAAKQKVEVAQQQLTLQQQQFAVARQAYEELQQIWINNQALQLAAHLVDGEPCPVCGSKEHAPNHTPQAEQQVSKELLQQKQQAMDAASKVFYTAEATVLAGQQQVAQIEQQLVAEQIDYASKVDYEQELQQVLQQQQQLEYAAKQLQQTTEQRKMLQQQQQQLQEQQQQLVERQQKGQMYIETKKVELQGLQQQIPAAYTNLAMLQQAIQSKQQRYEQLVQAFTKAQQAFEQARLNVTKLEEGVKHTEQQQQQLVAKQQNQQQQWQQVLLDSPFEDIAAFQAAIRTRPQLEQMQGEVTAFMQQLFALQQFVERESTELQNVQLVDLTELQQQLQQHKQQAEQLYAALSLTKDCIKTCEKYEENLQNVAQKIVELEEVANNILNLYNVLRGQNAKKISFERYVQIGYLEQITAAANERLLNLSNGQYKLVSSERQLSHGRQSGLSLDVHDSYTDQVRDVKTLSGGEKFNASLCLALGMADVIQSYEGNVRIDTMFIDEGFGSLDEESLNRAIDTLIDLQKSGRMIGIISHVGELKNAIPAVLEVMKLKEGYSKTKITVNA